MTNEASMQNNKPTLKQRFENEWEFVYPDSIDNEEVDEGFWAAVELVGYDDKRAEMIFKSIVSDHPFHIDAHNYLSIVFRNQNRDFESLLTAEKAYSLGKECISGDFEYGKDKLMWEYLDNRPFLRACHIYGLECVHAKKPESAMEVFNELLTFNKNDNQGVRYLLLEIYLASEKYTKARELLSRYPSDYSIEFKFASVSLDVLEGNLEQADKKLKEAVKVNRFFIDEVVRKKHRKPAPDVLDGQPYCGEVIARGSVQEACDYWSRNKAFYKNEKVLDYYKTRGKTPK